MTSDQGTSCNGMETCILASRLRERIWRPNRRAWLTGLMSPALHPKGRLAFAGFLSKELALHARKTTLPWILQWCRISKQQSALVFHVVWTSKSSLPWRQAPTHKPSRSSKSSTSTERGVGRRRGGMPRGDLLPTRSCQAQILAVHPKNRGMATC